MSMMTDILKERRVLTNLRLTDHQKAVLTRAFIAQTPRIATDNTNKNDSVVAARNQLVKLELVTFDGTNTIVTDSGIQLMQDEALVDENGEDLTELGNTFAYDEKDQPDEKQPGENGQPRGTPQGTPTPTGGEDPMASGLEPGDIGGGAQGGGAANLGIAKESYSLIRTLIQ